MSDLVGFLEIFNSGSPQLDYQINQLGELSLEKPTFK